MSEDFKPKYDYFCVRCRTTIKDWMDIDEITCKCKYLAQRVISLKEYKTLRTKNAQLKQRVKELEAGKVDLIALQKSWDDAQLKKTIPITPKISEDTSNAE